MTFDAERQDFIFGGKSLNDTYQEIRDVYARDNRPWVVGYSGGKDSTTVLQLIWYAISKLPSKDRNKPIYVISSNTLVETPIIVDYIRDTHKMIVKAANKKRLPFKSAILEPLLKDTFWVNLLGRGYAAPSTKFRWCTERLKVKTADRFIFEKVAEYGEVVLVLGLRKAESATRAQSMNLYKIKGSLLSRHSKFPQTYVYTPIENFSIDGVWDYLLTYQSPWGNDNTELFQLYKDADATECPLVVDDTTPSCGNSRFGCWVCTVVTKDKAVEALIESGEKWLTPLLKIRNFLASTQDPEKKRDFREYKRRNGTVSFKSDGSGKITPGPYKLEFCKDLLKQILKAEIEVRKNGPNKDIKLILPKELHEIRRMWLMERGDWQDSLPRIYREVMGGDLDWVYEDKVPFSATEEELLQGVCKAHKVPVRLVSKLLEAEQQVQGMGRRASIFNRLDAILNEEWRREEEIMREIRLNAGTKR